MTRNQKTVAVAALLLLLLLGTGAGGEPTTPTGTLDVPPKPEEPCPTGQEWIFDTASWSWVCTPITIPGKPAGPGEEPGTDDPILPGVVVDPAEPGESDDPNDWIKPYPGGDSFYQVVIEDRFYGEDPKHSIIYRYLRTEGFLAAKADGLDDAAANDYGKKVAKNSDNRVDALALNGCGPYNDACYATWGYDPGKDPAPGPNGRVIRLGPQNPNNRDRLFEGKPLARCVKIGSPQHKGNKSGVRVDGASGCNSYELLWLIKLDRALLRSSTSPNGRATIKPSPEPWSDGSPRTRPPPFIANRGVEFYAGSNTANVTAWGCAGIDLMELEE